eukprot:4181404-Ditylum_brightwellii.AAC.1
MTRENLSGGEQTTYTWKTPEALSELKYTNHMGSKDDGGWLQRGLDRFYAPQTKEKEQIKLMTKLQRQGGQKGPVIGSVHHAFDSDNDKLMQSEGTETNSDLSNGNNNEVDDTTMPMQ